VPLPHVDDALAEVERGLDSLGMVGVAVGCSVIGTPLDDPSFAPFFAELDRRGTVLFLHPIGAGAGPGTGDYGLTWMVGAPFEDTISGLRLVLSGMTARYPNIRVIVPHLGGTLPFLLARLDVQAANNRRTGGATFGIEGNPSDYVKQLWFDTVNLHPAALRCACESFGADRLLLGTDYPFMLGDTFRDCVRYVEQAGLPEADTRAILDQNAARLLGLE
jgi:aminocarboxymuconate-semialdehyde decarboxylase